MNKSFDEFCNNTFGIDERWDEIPSIKGQCISRYNINRQLGHNISPEYPDSSYAVKRLNLLHKLHGRFKSISSLCFNKKGNLLATTSNDDAKLTIWNWEKRKKLNVLPCAHIRDNDFEFYDLLWLPYDGESMLISSDSTGEMHTIDINTGIVHVYRTSDRQHALSSFIDRPYLVLFVDGDADIKSVDIRQNGKTRYSTRTPISIGDQLYDIDTNPTKCEEFCVAGSMSCVKVFDRRKSNEYLYNLFPEWIGPNNPYSYVDRVHYNHDGTEIIATYADIIYLFDISNNERKDYKYQYRPFTNNVYISKGANFLGPNSEFIVSSSDTGKILIWDKKTEKPMRWFRQDITYGDLRTHPHLPVIASSGNDVCIWAPTEKPVSIDV